MENLYATPADLKTLVEDAANAFDDRRKAARTVRKNSSNATINVAVNAERAALKRVENIVKKAKNDGYSHNLAVGIINRAEFRARERSLIVNGKVASDTPSIPEGKSRAGCTTMASAARSGRRDVLYGKAEDHLEAIVAHDTPDCGEDVEMDGEWL